MQPKKGDKQWNSAVIIQKNWKQFITRRNYLKKLKRQKKKVFTVMELLQSERTYVQNLEFVVKKVMIPSRALITDSEMHGFLFSNIEQIYNLHSHFLSKFEQTMKDFNQHLTKLSSVLMSQLFNKDQFKSGYTNYCFNYKTTDQVIKFVLDNNSSFIEHLKSIGFTVLNMSFQSYMIKPVQRLCKYGLIIHEYFRNMEADHIDYKNIGDTFELVDKLVHQTNDQVEEFLMRQRLIELKQLFPTFFSKIHSSKKLRMYYETKEINTLCVVRDNQVRYKSMALFQNSVILIPKIGEEPTFANFIYCRELMNHKYFKNIVQLVDHNKYNYIQFLQEKDKKEFMRILNVKLKQNEQEEFKEYIKVSILGTETRQSFFSSYTVYIVYIDDHGKTSTIYPRFKDLLKVQQMVISRGLQFNPVLLSKQSIISTLKSKTIEKRKLTIQQFLERIFNNCPIADIKEAEEILGVSSQLGSTVLQRASSQVQEVSVLLPNLQRVKVLIAIHESKIRDLKLLISEQMGMQSSNQFEIFEIRNKNYAIKKLLYDQQPVKKIYDQQLQNSTSINPFRDSLDYLYTRQYYLSKNQEEELYKCDQARAELQLSVIHWEVANYKLDEEVMLTFMCLFALYIHLPVENSDKLVFFIKQLTKKIYKVSEQEFRIYYSEVRRMVSGEDNLTQNLPLLIIKVVSNSYLYQTQQFDVEVHHKVYSAIKKMYPTIQQKIVLGLHPELMYLLSSKDRAIITKFSYFQLNILQNHPNALVFQLPHTQVRLTIKTNQAFQISKIFEIYKKHSS